MLLCLFLFESLKGIYPFNANENFIFCEFYEAKAEG
ncbi:hypothetical protein SAMN04488122_1372 [Chitinophaga arvensicola]|uniref:Uncharacterized protein n=1 Tax=Chitinophaga arvensicola TaxID=29529 RepID=A0A1I0QC73_9BACT|nr:hypothetical protein SAMN04488122_1372 [Chitinophaga arvensicola]